MIDPDYRLCQVRAISCTHHAHCVRAQLKPHATRQAWLTPNRRGDECQYFAPIEAFALAGSENLGQYPTVNAPQGVPSNGDGAAEYREVSGESDSANTLTPAGSDAANTEPRTNAEAGGVQSVGLALPPTRPVHALGLSNHETVAATPHGDARTFPERGARVIGVTVGDVVHEPAGVPGASAGLHPEQREQLHAARIIFGKQS